MPPVSEAGITARDITAALRLLYPRIPLSASAQEDGTFVVRMPDATARYWGVERDPQRAAAWLRKLPRPVEIRGVRIDKQAGGNSALVTLAVSGRPWPADPGSSRGIPAYATVGEVIGDFPANRQVTGLIRLAIDAGCRPHLYHAPSPHGHRYRVDLWHVNPELLHGVIDVMEVSGRFAEAWYSWGRGDERRTSVLSEIRQQLTSARDLHRGQTVAPRRRRPTGLHDTSSRPRGR
jgi:hypothetical protein